MKIISMTLYNRPEYTKKILERLSQCNDIQNYLLLVYIDPGSQEVVDLVNSIFFVEKKVIINRNRLGCDANIFQALSHAFKLSDFNIHIEDDIVTSKDTLNFFDYCNYRYKYDQEIFTISAYNRDKCDKKRYNIVKRRQWFHPWGWATWRDRWKNISQGWNTYWDVNINKNIRKSRYEIFPILSRTQNIGTYNGTHVKPDFHLENHFNQHWAGELDCNFYDFSEEHV